MDSCTHAFVVIALLMIYNQKVADFANTAKRRASAATQATT